MAFLNQDGSIKVGSTTIPINLKTDVNLIRTPSEAKKYAQDSGLTGAFNLLGDNYRDAWYVSQSKQEQV